MASGCIAGIGGAVVGRPRPDRNNPPITHSLAGDVYSRAWPCLLPARNSWCCGILCAGLRLAYDEPSRGSI